MVERDFFEPVVSHDKMHSNFIGTLGPASENARNLFNEWADGFIDRDNKIIKEFQTTFNSTFWEVYLYAVFKDYNFQVDFSYPRPDFLVGKNNFSIVVEATTSNAADGKTPEWEKKLINSKGEVCIPDRFDALNKEAMIRLCNSINAKEKKYTSSYSKLEHTKGKPFVIAIAPFEQPYFNMQYDRAIMSVLYDYYVNEDEFLDNPNKYPDGPPTEHLNYVTKDNGVDIPLGFFCNKDYENISAVIFNCSATFGKLQALANKNNDNVHIYSTWSTYPEGKPTPIIAKSSDYLEEISDGLMVFHNPFAKVPVPTDFFRKNRVVQVYSDESSYLIFENYNDCLQSRSVQTMPLKPIEPNGTSC